MKVTGPQLTEVLPRELLVRLQTDVTRLVQTSGISFRSDGTVLCPLDAVAPYCRAVVSTPEGQVRCTQSHRDLGLEAIHTRQTVEATCHAGVPMAAVPVVAGGDALAVTVVSTAPSPVSKDYLPLTAEAVGVPTSTLEAACRSSSQTEGAADTLLALWETLNRLYSHVFAGLREAQQHTDQVASAERRARSLLNLMSAISASLSVSEVMEALAEPLAVMAGMDRCLLFTPYARTGAFALEADFGLNGDELKSLDPQPAVQLRLGDEWDERLRTGLPIATPEGWLSATLPAIPTVPGFSSTGLLLPLCSGQRVMGIALLDGLRSPADMPAEDRDRLASLGRLAASALSNANDFLREQHVARTLQQGLETAVPNAIGCYTFADCYEPAFWEEGVGGDFYDALELPDGRIALLLGDVSGKGVESAVHAGQVKFLVRGLALNDPTPAAVVAQLNNALCREHPTGGFITLFYGLLDPAQDQLAYTLAGHEPPLLHSPSRGFTVPLQSRGPAAGFLPEAQFPEESISLQGGDQIILYTDGAVEARSSAGEFFGLDRLKAVVRKEGSTTATGLLDAIMRALHDATGGNVADDLALLILRREPSPEPR